MGRCRGRCWRPWPAGGRPLRQWLLSPAPGRTRDGARRSFDLGRGAAAAGPRRGQCRARGVRGGGVQCRARLWGRPAAGAPRTAGSGAPARRCGARCAAACTVRGPASTGPGRAAARGRITLAGIPLAPRGRGQAFQAHRHDRHGQEHGDPRAAHRGACARRPCGDRRSGRRLPAALLRCSAAAM